MAQAQPRDRRALTGIAVLVVGLLLAAGVAAYLFLSGGDSASTPEDTVREMFDALGDGHTAAFDALLDPEVRGSQRVSVIPNAFALSPNSESLPDITGLTIDPLGREGDWALVGVRGQVKAPDGDKAFTDVVYLVQENGTWYGSNQAAYARSKAFQGTPTAAVEQPGLGPLDPQRPEVGQPAPDFALIDARDGRTVRKLSDFKGTPVVVNWYASWCGPCKNEIPEFQAAQQALGDKVVFLGVDYQEGQSDAVKILQDNNAAYPAVLDSHGSVAEHYRVSVFPTTYFVDAGGVVRALKVGEVHADDLEKNLAAIGVTYSPD
ncbi:MAG: redoxin domain-containing protein [Hyphomicrobiales bacterium]